MFFHLKNRSETDRKEGKYKKKKQGNIKRVVWNYICQPQNVIFSYSPPTPETWRDRDRTKFFFRVWRERSDV